MAIGRRAADVRFPATPLLDGALLLVLALGVLVASDAPERPLESRERVAAVPEEPVLVRPVLHVLPDGTMITKRRER